MSPPLLVVVPTADDGLGFDAILSGSGNVKLGGSGYLKSGGPAILKLGGSGWMKFCMKRRRKVAAIEKCTKFPMDLLKQRTIDDVLTTDESAAIYDKLTEIDSESANFFLILLHTGMRVSEGLGVSLADVYSGEPQVEKLQKLLNSYGLGSLGYVAIDSQVRASNCVRLADGKVPRKPLKGRKKIDADKGRIVPIFNKDAYNVLARKFESLHLDFDRKKFGGDEKDYLFFEDMTERRIYGVMVKAYEAMKGKHRHKSPHCLRHTFSTWLAGETLGNHAVCKLVLGHKDEKTTERYVHIYAAMNRAVRRKGEGNRRLKVIA